MPNKLITEIKNIRRLRQIMGVSIQEGFGQLIEQIRLSSLIKAKARRKERFPKEVRLRLTLEKLGPTFIKFGQILSLRPDLIPKKYTKELEKLQDKVPSFSYKQVEDIIQQELGKPISQLFKSFNKKPIASASIAQVHKAELPNGKIVAVKVQRPNVKEIMKSDIEVMFYIASLLERYAPKIRKYNPVGIIKEFKEWTERELDFEIEASNAKRFYKNFMGSELVVIPKVFDDYSTKKVMVSDFIDGIPLHHIRRIKGKKGYSIKAIIKNGFDAIFTQVFVHGFFHADPHPGNILILKGNRIGFVDFGIVGRFNKRLKQKSTDLSYSIIDGDADGIADAILSMGFVNKEADIESFRKEIEDVVNSLQDGPLKKAKLSSVLEEVLDITLEHNIRIPVDFVLFGKTIIEIEGIALEYAPNFKFTENAGPFLERLIKRKINLMGMPKDFIKSLIKFKKFIQDFPAETTKALKTIQRGKVKIDIEDSDIKRLSLEIDRSSNRLAYGMLITALILAGSLTINVDMPKLFNMPLISLIAYLLAAIMGVILLSSIISENELKR